MKRTLALILTLILGLGVLSGCQRAEPDLTPTDPSAGDTGTEPATPSEPEEVTEDVPLPEGEGTLKIAATADISTLNPHTYSMSRDSDGIGKLAMLLYKSFIGENEKFSYQPEFAADFPQQMDDTQTVWQIPLREGLVWENGDPMNADTVIYTYKTLLDPKLLNSRASSFADNVIVVLNGTEYTAGECEWEDVGLKKIDDYTVELTTAAPVTSDEIVNHFVNSALVMVHEGTYEAAMNADRTATMYGTSKDTYMSCGPFVIKDWIAGATIVYEKNPNYVFADKIWLNSIDERTVGEASTRLQMFLNGELDYVSLGSEEYLQYKEDPRIIESDATSMWHISVNMGNTENPILSSTNFRKALYYGTDREAVAAINNVIPAWWIQPKMVVGDLDTGETYRDMVERIQPYEIPENNGYDPEKALEYFEAALEETGLDSVSVTLIYPSDSTGSYKPASEYLQKSWAEIFGADRFQMELQGMPNSQMVGTKKDWINNPNSYEMSWGGWSTSKVAPWNGFNVWTTDYPQKNEPYSNAEFDDLWVRANQSEERFDKEARLDMTFRMEEIMLEEAAIIPVMESPGRYLKADRVQLPTSDNSYVVNVGFGWMYARIVEE